MPQRRVVATFHNRLVSLTNDLRRSGCSIRNLAERYGVTILTIRRDLRLLTELGLPIVQVRDSHGQKAWRIAQNEIAALRGG